MGELHDPPLRLTIDGLRWAGGDQADAGSWESNGTPGTVSFFGTDHDEDSIALLRLLRRMLVKRTGHMITVLAVRFDALDWDAPNPPTTSDLSGLVALLDTLGDQFRALHELAPEVIDDDAAEGHAMRQEKR